MTDSDRLERIETKLDKVADEIAELRGAHKALYALATILGAIGGVVVTYFTGKH